MTTIFDIGVLDTAEKFPGHFASLLFRSKAAITPQRQAPHVALALLLHPAEVLGSVALERPVDVYAASQAATRGVCKRIY